MSKLLLGTTNPGKIAELRVWLGPRVLVQGLADLGVEIPEVIEDGKTYFENAWKKAEAYYRMSGLPVLTDDSGLEVDALSGAPGIHSAYYGGADLSWPQRWDYLLDQILRSGSAEPWHARFRCVLCYFDGAQRHYFEGVSEGHVLAQPTGKGGFGYDPVVFSRELGVSFGEASVEAKNRVSHRAKALKLFGEWLDQRSSHS